MTFLQGLEAAKEAGDIGWIATYVPYARFLGIRHQLTDTGELVVTMPFHSRLVGNPAVPALHGGGMGSLLEHTAISLLLWQLHVLSVPKTITLSVDYLRPGRLEDTFASARIKKHGRRVVNVHAEAWQTSRDRLIAMATVHCLVHTAQE